MPSLTAPLPLGFGLHLFQAAAANSAAYSCREWRCDERAGLVCLREGRDSVGLYLTNHARHQHGEFCEKLVECVLGSVELVCGSGLHRHHST